MLVSFVVTLDYCGNFLSLEATIPVLILRGRLTAPSQVQLLESRLEF